MARNRASVLEPVPDPQPDGQTGDQTPDGQTGDQTPDQTSVQVEAERCSGKSEAGRQCVLTSGHDGDHKYRAKGEKNPVLAPVPLDLIEAEEVPEDEWASHPLAAGPVRNEAQVAIDVLVAEAHKNWMEAGKPDVKRSPRKRMAVPPEHAAGVRFMLGQAAKLHGTKVHIQPASHRPDGREVIVFTATDKPERKTAKGAGTVPESRQEN